MYCYVQVTFVIQAMMVLHTVHNILTAVALDFSHARIKSIHRTILGQRNLFTIIRPVIGTLFNLATIPIHHQDQGMDLVLLV